MRPSQRALLVPVRKFQWSDVPLGLAGYIRRFFASADSCFCRYIPPIQPPRSKLFPHAKPSLDTQTYRTLSNRMSFLADLQFPTLFTIRASGLRPCGEDAPACVNPGAIPLRTRLHPCELHSRNSRLVSFQRVANRRQDTISFQNVLKRSLSAFESRPMSLASPSEWCFAFCSAPSFHESICQE